MFLETMKIEGYKNFGEPFDVQFAKGLNVLVGENGAGKSAIIDALRLILMEDEYLDSQKFNRVQAASLSFTAVGGRRLFRIIR